MKLSTIEVNAPHICDDSLVLPIITRLEPCLDEFEIHRSWNDRAVLKPPLRWRWLRRRLRV